LGENVGTIRPFPYFFQALALGLILCFGGWSGTRADEVPNSLPQDSFFSSLKQAIKKDFDHEVVRGYFDIGTAPNVRRYYCMVDPKTGKKDTNAILGEPIPAADGMTGIKDGSVSMYNCDRAEKQGMLVTTGYVLKGGAAGSNAPPPPTPPQVQSQVQPQAPTPTPTPPPPTTAPAAAPAPAAVAAVPTAAADATPDQVDVAGVKLGMSPEEVRAVLRSKRLPGYFESTDTLGHFDSARGAAPPTAGLRFVNVIASWAPGEDEESYEVMFTPVPGRERAMAIIHSVGYSAANAVRETTLAGGLVKKYGGYAAPGDLPASPTWRIQNGGAVQVGDACNRRGLFGGLNALNGGSVIRQNLALKTTLDEFRFQLDRCGVAIVTEDHSTSNGGAPREERLLTRFTVTAYSPAIGFEGATAAAQMIQTAGAAAMKGSASRAKEPLVPNL
jgi:hypothetical protein